MRKRLVFRRPIYILTDKDRGVITAPWIVLFGKLPHLYDTRDMDTQSNMQVHRVERKVVQYRYILKIDLWLAILDFEWLGHLS